MRGIENFYIHSILKNLSKHYPNARTALQYKDPFHLIIATILSAQSTDKQINKLTPALFSRFTTPKDFAEADIKEIENNNVSVALYYGSILITSSLLPLTSTQ